MDRTIDTYVFTRRDGHRVSITSENTASTTVHAGLFMVPEGLFEEVLRLAQRVQELEATVCTMGERDGQHLARIAALEEGDERETRIVRLREDLAAARSANDLLGAKINRLERHVSDARRQLRSDCGELGDNDWSDNLHLSDVIEKHLARPAYARIEELESSLVEKDHQLALAKETAASLRELDVNRQRVILGLREPLAASESRGRQYCLELAEKAEEISEIGRDRNLMAQRVRELEEALGRALSDAGWHKRKADSLEVGNTALANRVRELQEQLAGEIMENHALKMTIEEGSEIEAELAGALAAGHGEDLKPCIAPCPGHLGLKASAAVDRAAGARRALETSLDELKAILREHGLLPAKYEDEEGERLQGEVPNAGPRIWRSAGPPLEETVAGLRDRVADAEQNLDDRADRLKALEAHVDRQVAVAEAIQEGIAFVKGKE